jgi:hypothetical protein
MESARSTWHFSYAQTAILNIELKIGNAGFVLKELSRFIAGFWTQPMCYEDFTDRCRA